MPAQVAPQYFAAISAAMGVFALGSSIGWINPAHNAIQSGGYGFSVTEDDLSWIGSLLMLGPCLSCIPTGVLIKLIGRRKTMMWLVVPFYIGWILLVFAQSVWMLCVGRFILGFAGGAFCISCPVYITEIAQKEIRGILGTFFQLFITGGILYAYIIGATENLKLLNYCCAILPIFSFLLLLINPESPIYYFNTGQDEKGIAAMRRLRGDDVDITAEVNEIKSDIAKSKDANAKLVELFADRVTLKALSLSLFLMALQQFSGINAIVFYSTFIFSKANGDIEPKASTIIIGLIMFLSTFISTAIVDQLGRKCLLILSAAFMGVSTLVFGFYFHLLEKDESSVASVNWLPISSLCTFIIAFSIGLGPIPWLFLSEVFNNEVRDLAGSVSGTINWVLAFVVTKSFMFARESIGISWVFWFFTLVCISGTVVTILFIPETKGKTTHQIQQALGAP